MKTKICSFNVKGLGEFKKRNHIFSWLKDKEYNICCLQELHCTTSDLDKWEKEWGSKIFLSGNSSNSKGIGIFVNGSFQIIEYKELIEGRLQCLSLVIDNNEIMLMNVYGPNTDDVDFFSTIEDFVENNEDKTIIIGGDFNVILDTKKDKKHGRSDTHKKSRSKLNTIMENNNLVDIWRIMHPDLKLYTWHSNQKPPIFCRLDYFLISSNISNKVSKCNITTGIKSDHSLIYLNLDLTNRDRGPSYFKLNNSVILEDDYQRQIRNSIAETVENNV